MFISLTFSLFLNSIEMSVNENKKALVFSILEFLQKSCEDGTINKDDTEGIEGNVVYKDEIRPPFSYIMMLSCYAMYW